jgi:ATP-binding cassette subfamily B (MDR/TAP) protein 1
MTTRFLIMTAIRRWRRNKTTIVITHELGWDMIEKEDYVYILHNGRVQEQGYVVYLRSY